MMKYFQNLLNLVIHFIKSNQGSNILEDIKKCNPGTNTRLGKQAKPTKNVKKQNNAYKATKVNEQGTLGLF